MTTHKIRAPFILRSFSLEPSRPGSYRTSTLSWWWWCAEQSYWKALGVDDHGQAKLEKFTGESIHDLIHKLGRRWTWENKFLEELEKHRKTGYGLVRRIEDEQIYNDITGHPDEFQVTLSKRVSVIEINTTGITNLDFYNRYRLPIKQFQAQIYCHILDPILQQIGYQLDKMHVVNVWHVKYRQEAGVRKLVDWTHLEDVPIFYYPQQVETQIKQILDAYRNPKLIIPPRGFPNCFKCKQCPKVYKERCQFWNASKTPVPPVLDEEAIKLAHSTGDPSQGVPRDEIPD